jgi:hypothetical protein
MTLYRTTLPFLAAAVSTSYPPKGIWLQISVVNLWGWSAEVMLIISRAKHLPHCRVIID